MNNIYELFEKAKSNLDEFEFEEFAHNTIKTIGYNSNTFSLLQNVNKTLPTTKYEEFIKNNLIECAKVNNHDLDNIDLNSDYNSFKEEMCNYMSEEEFDGIMFDSSIMLVDDYLNYNRLHGIDLLENINEYVNDFSSGADLILNDKNYENIKEDIYNDAGLSLIGLENLVMDTSDFSEIDDIALEETVDVSLEHEK